MIFYGQGSSLVVHCRGKSVWIPKEAQAASSLPSMASHWPVSKIF
jgi:hypothetical protein